MLTRHLTTPAGRLDVGVLTQISGEAQPDAGFARLSRRSIRAGCRKVLGEQLLDGEGGRVVCGRDLYYRKARLGDVCVED